MIRTADLISKKSSDLLIKYDDSYLCPHCNTFGNLKLINAYAPVTTSFNQSNVIRNAGMLFECSKCDELSFLYGNVSRPNEYSTYSLINYKIFPKLNNEKKFPKNLEKISPRFCSTYNKALAIKNNGDDESAGMIFRKALEFLIKDFLISFEENDENNIKDLSLSKCIENYFHEDDLKYPAKLSIWIGNDFSHYYAKNEDMGLDDMLEYLDTFIAYINYKLTSKKAKTTVLSKSS